MRLLRWTGILGGTVGGLTLLLLVLAGVFRPKVATHPVAAALPSAEGRRVAVVRLIRQPREETAVGTVRPVHEASVASKLLSRVVEVNVKAGQVVNANDVLIRLDDAELQTRLKQAEAAQTSAEATLAKSRIDEERIRKLFDRNAASRADVDRTETAVKTADAELQRTQQSVAEARVLLDFATIRSPLTGVVVEKRVEPGDMASPGQVLLTMYEPNRMQMVATVRESLAQRLQVGDQVPARLEAMDHECLATISEIVPQAQAASRSFTVKVTGPCPPGAYSGMFGRISIPLEAEEVVVVPEAAVFHVGQLNLVEVVAEGVVRRRSVQLGRELPAGYEVLAGLQVGEQVVLRDGKEQRG
jgi:RND family efflux transporter MFP subunit